MNKPNKHRLLQASIAVIVLVALILPIASSKVDMTPNQFLVQYYTYLDEYSVSLRTYGARGDSDKVRSITQADRPASLFGQDFTRVELVFAKNPVATGADFEYRGEAFSDTSGQRDTWLWSGQELTMGELDTLVLDPGANFQYEQSDLWVWANGERLTPSGTRDGRYYYTAEEDHRWLESVRIEAPSGSGPPVSAVRVLERDRQSIFLQDLSLARDIADLKYRHEILSFSLRDLRSSFKEGSGVRNVQSVEDHVRVEPSDVEVVLPLSETWSASKSDLDTSARSIELVLWGFFFAFFALAWWLLYRFIPPVGRGHLQKLRNDSFAAMLLQPITRPTLELAYAALVGLTFFAFVIPRGSVLGLAISAIIFVLMVVILYVRNRLGSDSPKAHLKNTHSALILWALFFVTAFMALTQLYRLGEAFMWVDETFSYFPAKLILETGEPRYQATGFLYDRAYLYHWVVAQFFEWFGVSPWAGRLPNILFNLGTLFVVYLFGRECSKWAGVAAAGFWASTNYVLAITRWVRMYPAEWFVFVLAAYVFYKAVVKPVRPLLYIRVRGVDLSFSPLFFVFFIVAFLVALHVQLLAIVFVWGLAGFFLLQVILSDQRARAAIGLAVSICVILLAAWYRTGSFSLFEAYFSAFIDSGGSYSPNVARTINTFRENTALWPLIPAAAAIALFGRDKLTRYSFSIAVIGIVFFGYQHRQAFRYATVLIPFVVLSLVLTAHTMASALSVSRPMRFGLLVVVFIPALFVQTRLYVREMGEVNYAYNDGAIATQQKREETGEVLTFMHLFAGEEQRLVSDSPFSYILAAHGLEIDAFVRTQNFNEAYPTSNRRGTPALDPYTTITELDADSQGVFVATTSRRDPNEWWLAQVLEKHPQFEKSQVYVPPVKPKGIAW